MSFCLDCVKQKTSFFRMKNSLYKRLHSNNVFDNRHLFVAFAGNLKERFTCFLNWSQPDCGTAHEVLLNETNRLHEAIGSSILSASELLKDSESNFSVNYVPILYPVVLNYVPQSKFTFEASEAIQLLHDYCADETLVTRILRTLNSTSAFKQYSQKFKFTNSSESVLQLVSKWVINSHIPIEWTILNLLVQENPLLIHLPPEYLYALDPQELKYFSFYVQYITDILDSNEIWNNTSRLLKRSWIRLLSKENITALGLFRSRNIVPELSIEELSPLLLSIENVSHVLSVDWSTIQARFICDQMLQNSEKIPETAMHLFVYLLPRQIQNLSLEFLFQVKEGLYSINNDELTKLGALQLYEYMSAILEKQLESSLNSNVAKYIDVGKYLFHTQSLSYLANRFNNSLSIKESIILDSKKYTPLQARFILGPNEFKKSWQNLLGLYGLLAAIPASTFINQQIKDGSCDDTILKHMLNYSPSGNKPRASAILQLAKREFENKDYLTDIQSNSNHEVLSLLSPVYISEKSQYLLDNFETLLQNDDDTLIDKLPTHIALRLIWNETLNWNSVSKFTFLKRRLFVVAMNCELLHKIPLIDFISVFSLYNRERSKINQAFPKDLQKCAQIRVYEYMKLKDAFHNSARSSFEIDLWDIRSVGGYVLASLPLDVIKNSDNKFEILKEIGHLSLPELLLAVPKQHLFNLTSMFVEEKVNGTIKLEHLMLLGNLTHFLLPRNLMMINFEAFKFIVEAEYIDTRICGDHSVRSVWSKLLINSFGRTKEWREDSVLKIKDLLMSLPESELHKLQPQVLKNIADLIRSDYESYVPWIPEQLPFYKACLTTLPRNEIDSYTNSIAKLMQFYLRAVQMQLSTIKKVDEILTFDFSGVISKYRASMVTDYFTESIIDATNTVTKSVYTNGINTVNSVSEDTDDNEVSNYRTESVTDTNAEITMSSTMVTDNVPSSNTNDNAPTPVPVTITNIETTIHSLMVTDIISSSAVNLAGTSITEVVTSNTEAAISSEMVTDNVSIINKDNVTATPATQTMTTTDQAELETITHNKANTATTESYTANVSVNRTSKDNKASTISATESSTANITTTSEKFESSVTLKDESKESVGAGTAYTTESSEWFTTKIGTTINHGGMYVSSYNESEVDTVSVLVTESPDTEIAVTTDQLVYESKNTLTSTNEAAVSTTELPVPLIVASTEQDKVDLNNTSKYAKETQAFTIVSSSTIEQDQSLLYNTLKNTEASEFLATKFTVTTEPKIHTTFDTISDMNSEVALTKDTTDRFTESQTQTGNLITSSQATTVNESFANDNNRYLTAMNPKLIIPGYLMNDSSTGFVFRTKPVNITLGNVNLNNRALDNFTSTLAAETFETTSNSVEVENLSATGSTMRAKHVSDSGSATSNYLNMTEYETFTDTQSDIDANMLPVVNNGTFTAALSSDDGRTNVASNFVDRVQLISSGMSTRSIIMPASMSEVTSNVRGFTPEYSLKSTTDNAYVLKTSRLARNSTSALNMSEVTSNNIEFSSEYSTDKVYILLNNSSNAFESTPSSEYYMYNNQNNTVISEGKRNISIRSAENNEKLSKHNSIKEEVLQEGHLRTILKHLNFGLNRDCNGNGNCRKKRDARNSVTAKVSCEALKIFGPSSALVIPFLNLTSEWSDDDIFDCVELFAAMDLPAETKMQIWSRVKSKLNSENMYFAAGSLLSSINNEDLETFNLNINNDWSMELLFWLSEYVEEEEMIKSIATKFKIENDEFDKKPFPSAAIISLGNILCYMPEFTLRRWLSNAEVIHDVWWSFHRIKGCPRTCLHNIANAMIEAFGDVDRWNSDIIAMMGPAISELEEARWDLLNKSNPMFAYNLQPISVRCLLPETLAKMSASQLLQLPLSSLKLLSEHQKSKLSDYNNEIVRLRSIEIEEPQRGYPVPKDDRMLNLWKKIQEKSESGKAKTPIAISVLAPRYDGPLRGFEIEEEEKRPLECSRMTPKFEDLSANKQVYDYFKGFMDHKMASEVLFAWQMIDGSDGISEPKLRASCSNDINHGPIVRTNEAQKLLRDRLFQFPDNVREKILSVMDRSHDDLNDVTVASLKPILTDTMLEYWDDFTRSEWYYRYQVALLISKSVTLGDVLRHELALSYFMQFLDSEDCQSVLEFWIVVTNFEEFMNNAIKNCDLDVNQAVNDAVSIYEKYLSLQATCPLGFSDDVRCAVELAICDASGPTVHCFRAAVTVAIAYLRRCLRQFFASQHYVHLLTEMIRSGTTAHSPASSISECSVERPLLANDPETIWRRRKQSGLSFGRIDQLGRFQRDIEPDPERNNESKIAKLMKKWVRKNNNPVEEELASQVAEMILKDILDVTMGCPPEDESNVF